MTHPLVSWLAQQSPRYDLSHLPPEKALRLTVHELAHAVSLGLEFEGLNPDVLGEAIASMEPLAAWRDEILARQVEHVVLPRLTGAEQPTLEARIKTAIRISERALESAREGCLIGYENKPLPVFLPLEGSLQIAAQLAEAGTPERIARVILSHPAAVPQP